LLNRLLRHQFGICTIRRVRGAGTRDARVVHKNVDVSRPAAKSDPHAAGTFSAACAIFCARTSPGVANRFAAAYRQRGEERMKKSPALLCVAVLADLMLVALAGGLVWLVLLCLSGALL